MPVDILSQSASFFDQAGRPDAALMPLQVDPTAPAINGLTVATGMALPDRTVRDRLQHFPADIYDLRDSSHLVRLMKALLGDSGTGQLRKRNLVAQFQTAMQSTHFYDLDRFYGAIFGVTRTIGEILWISPNADLATQNEWDQLSDADANFRERIFNLARAINLGATYPGIQSAAEALTQTHVDVYEAWDLLDTYGPGTLGNHWDDIEAMGTWDDIEAQDPTPYRPTYIDLSAAVTIGRTGTNNRSEVIVVPRKDYTRILDEDGPDEEARARAEDEHSIIRVLSVLKPASVLLTVDTQGLALYHDAQIASLLADSNFWNIATRTAPRPDLVSPNGSPYPLSTQQADQGLLDSDKREIPKPPWTVQQGSQWSYAPEMVTVRAFSFQAGSGDTLDAPGDGPITDAFDEHVITYTDGTREKFSADRAAMDPRRALAARYSSEGLLSAHAYAGDRTKVETRD